MTDIDERERSFRLTTLLGFNPKEEKNYVGRKTDTRVFIAAFFIIAETGRSPRCPSADEQPHTLWSTQTMEC